MSTRFIKRVEEAPAYIRVAAVFAVVSALTFAAYSNSFHASFHLDDSHQIYSNHYIRNISNIYRFFIERGVNSYDPDVDYYRPVTTASFALSYAMTGMDVAGFHMMNFALHVFNALLVYIITAFVLKRASSSDNPALPLIISLAFALHPIQTQAVTYISGRAVLLASFFSLFTFYAFIRFRETSGKSAYLWGAASPALFIMGLLSKEMSAGIIGVMLAYDLIFLPAAARRDGKTWLYYIPFALCVAVLLAARYFLGILSAVSVIDYSAGEYLMSSANTLLMYTRLLLLPINQNADYALPLTRAADFKVVLAVTAVAAYLYLLYRIRKRLPAETFFGCWFIIALLPESSIFPIHDIAVEYRLYLPSVGFVAMAALLIQKIACPVAARRAAGLSVLLLLGILTLNRNSVYADDYTYWSDIARKSPHSARAAFSLGKALVSKGRYAEAVPVLEKALALDTDYPEQHKVRSHLGLSYYRLGRVDNAIEQYNISLRLMPDYLESYEELGSLYYETGRYEDAARVFQRETELFSGNPTAEYNLAASLMMLKKDDEAVGHLLNSLDYGLDNFDVRYNLALMYERSGDAGDALEHANMAIGLAADENERFMAAELIARLGG